MSIPLLVALSFVPPLSTDAPTLPPDEVVTIGSWNLEWFGTPHRRGGMARTRADVWEIAAVLTENRIDIVMLQEIATQSLQWRWLASALEQRGYRYVAGSSGGRQRIVLAWNAEKVWRVDVGAATEPALSSEFRLGKRCHSRKLRLPLMATLRAGAFDFTIVGLHLKGPIRPAGCHRRDTNQRIRRRQLDELLAELARRRQRAEVDSDTILIGDMNSQLRDPGVRHLSRSGYRLLTADAHRKPGSGRISYRKGRKVALDHVAITSGALAEAIPQSTEYARVLTTGSRTARARFRRRFSDHAPVWTRFSTAGPDDD